VTTVRLLVCRFSNRCRALIVKHGGKIKNRYKEEKLNYLNQTLRLSANSLQMTLPEQTYFARILFLRF